MNNSNKNNMAGILLPTKLNGYSLMWDPDGGSDINIISKHHLQELRSAGLSIKLRPVTKNYLSISHEKLSMEGFFTATLSSPSTSIHNEKIFVMSKMPSSDHPILREKALLDLGLMKYSITGEFVKHTSKLSKPAVDIRIADKHWKKQFEIITENFSHCFDRQGCLKGYQADIKLTSSAEEFIHRAAPCPIHLQDAGSKRISEFEKNGIWEKLPPNHPIRFCSSVLMCEKPPKAGSKEIRVRIVGNFKKINGFLKRNVIVPAPRVEEFMSKMSGCLYFGKTDLVDGYNQIVIKPSCRDLFVVSTFKGNYRYKRLPQGCKISQDIFDERIQMLLAHVQRCIVNRDDILFGSPTLEGLAQTYEQILRAFSDANVTCSSLKTVIGVTQISFHGFIFDSSGMKPDPSKIESLQNTKRPETQKGVVSFVCTVGWNARFIHKFSEHAQPLRALALSKGDFIWLDVHEAAFNYLKAALCKNCLNNYFIKGRRTAVFTDAGSKKHNHDEPGAFAGILAQQCEKTKSWLPIQYASRAMTDTERRWSQVELEAAAVRVMLDRFRFYLSGCYPPFEVYTDSQPVVQFYNKMPKTTPLRILRQVLACQDLDFICIYLEGSQNPADWPSRCDAPPPTKNDLAISDDLETSIVRLVRSNGDPVCQNDLRDATKVDEELQFLIQRIDLNDWEKHKKHPFISPYSGIRHELSYIDGLVYRGETQIIVPSKLRSRVTDLVHNFGHMGISHTTSLLTDKFWFPGLTAFIQNVVSSCEQCQHTKLSKRKDPFGIAPIPTEPFQKISIDFKDLPNGYYVLVFICLHSKFPDVAFVRTPSMEAVREPMLTYFSLYGTPLIIVSDNGSPMNSKEYAKFAQEQGFTPKPVTKKNPKANSTCERVMATIDQAWQRSQLTGSNWRHEILAAIKAFRATPRKNRPSPYEIAFNRKMNWGQIQTLTQPSLAPKVVKSSKMASKRYKTVADQLYASSLGNAQKHNERKNVKEHDFRVHDEVLVISDLGAKFKKRYNKEIYIITQIHHGTITAVCPENGKTITRRAQHFKRFIRKPAADKQKVARERKFSDPTDTSDEDYDDLPDSQKVLGNNQPDNENVVSDSDTVSNSDSDSFHDFNSDDDPESDDTLVDENQDRDSPVPYQEAEPALEVSLGDQDVLSEIGDSAEITSPQALGSKKDLVPDGDVAHSGQATSTVQNRPSHSRNYHRSGRSKVNFSPLKEIQTYQPAAPAQSIQESFSLARRGRSAGPAPNLPNVLPSELERSSQLRRDISELHQQHEQQKHLDRKQQ